MSWSSFGAMTSSARGARRATDRIGSGSRERVRTAAAATIAREPIAGQRVADLTHAVADRVMQLGERGVRHDRGNRQVRGGEDRDGGTHAHAEQRDRSEPARAQEVDGRGDVASLVRAERHEARVALPVAAEVELEDMVAIVEPRHEGFQLGEAIAAEAVEHDHRGARLASGRDQPPGQGDAVIGREADGLVVEADDRPDSPARRPVSGSNGRTTGLTSSRDPRTAT